MKVVNHVQPHDPKQIEELMQPGPDKPIFMVNLLKFKEKAEYEDGRETDLSGKDAYGLYGMAVSQILPKFGGQIFFVANTTFLQLGEVEELWDEVAIAVYPNRKVLLDMSMSAEWQEASVHRTAGLKGQLNIETVAKAGIEGLPWISALLGAMPK